MQQAQNLKSRLFLNFRFAIQLVSDTLPPFRHQSTSAGERIRACSKLNKNEALVRHARTYRWEKCLSGSGDRLAPHRIPVVFDVYRAGAPSPRHSPIADTSADAPPSSAVAVNDTGRTDYRSCPRSCSSMPPLDGANIACKSRKNKEKSGGADGTRTRDPRRDRPVF